MNGVGAVRSSPSPGGEGLGCGRTVSSASHRDPSPFRARTLAHARVRSSPLPPGEGRDARYSPKIPLSALPKPQPDQTPTLFHPPISRPGSGPCHHPGVPSHGGSLGRRSAAAAGADGAGATRSQTLRGRLPRGCEVEPGGRPDGPGAGRSTRTGPGDGRCHPCPPRADGPLVKSDAHGLGTVETRPRGASDVRRNTIPYGLRAFARRSANAPHRRRTGAARRRARRRIRPQLDLG